VLSGLTVLGDACLELACAGRYDQHSAVCLGGACNHVLDEISVSGGINDGDKKLGGLKLPKSDVDGDATLTFSFQLVKDPCVFK